MGTSEWDLGTTSSLDEAPVLPGYLVYEQLQAIASHNTNVTSSTVVDSTGENEIRSGRRRVSLMDERLADLEDTTSKSLMGIESMVRNIIEEDANQLSISSYSSSVDSYAATDEEGESRVVRRQRYHHHHESDSARKETLSTERSDSQPSPQPPQQAPTAVATVESEIETVQKSQQ